MAMHQRGRLLLIGFVLSLALHAALMALLPMPHTRANEELTEILVVDHVPSAAPKPKRSPPPATPTPQRHESAVSHLALHHARKTPHLRTPTVTHHSGGAPQIVIAGDAGTGTTAAGTGGESPGTDDDGGAAVRSPVASPMPLPTATPATCALPEVAALTVNAAAPEIPPLAATQGITGDVEVIVNLDAQSRLIGARVRSTPSVLLNAAALGAARASIFRTAVHDCVPIAAEYVFTVAFTAD